MLTASIIPEADAYVARCVELPVTSDGATAEEALANLREAVELYLDEPAGRAPTVRHFTVSAA
jgi:predicted RNase H-like HicB family nuclease